MNWNQVIEFNKAALTSIVAEIFALLELVLDGTIARLPRVFETAANRLLIPAESALRRLIMIAAQGVKAKALRHRPLPPGKKITSNATGPLSFQLFDVRKNFNQPARTKRNKAIQPRIHFFNTVPFIGQLLPARKKLRTSTQLCRRFAAFKLALENIPHQAQRLANWRVKRANLAQAKFRFPLRPGAPPGFRRALEYDVDRVLKECHLLALDAEREAPS